MIQPQAPVHRFSTKRITRMLNVTMRQLQWWDESGLLQPDIVKHRRIYSRDDLYIITVIVSLRRRGVPLQHIRRSIKGIRRQISTATFRVGASFVVTDSLCRALTITRDLERVLSLLSDSDSPMVLTHLPDFDDMVGDIDFIPKAVKRV